MNQTIGWSDFAKGRCRKGKGYSYSTLSDEAVCQLVADNWTKRTPAWGKCVDMTHKVVVPVPAFCFVCPHVFLSPEMAGDVFLVRAKVMRRQDGEDLFVRNYIRSKDAERLHLEPELARYASVVCYSADALLENGGTRSTDCDWEIVSIFASAVENEPMNPLAMARNQLVKAGGTKSEYTAEQYAEAIYYWSQRVPILED